MPAASTKTDTKASTEVTSAIQQAIAVVDKKVRNLEKRKSKLDIIRKKAEDGFELEHDQQVAIKKYELVIQSLEFARELKMQFVTINNETEKLLRKQAKREKIEKQALETKRIRELLKLQTLLDNMGSDKVRNDFKTGKHGAVVLTEENLNQLDELYQLISPSRDDDNYAEQLASAAEHIVSLLDSKEKEVVGTTYKELKDLINLIGDCGYFENARKAEEQVEAPVAKETEDIVEKMGSVDVAVASEVAPEPEELSFDQVIVQPESGTMDKVPSSQISEIQQSAFYTDSYTEQRQKPVDEIITPMQGTFNFLQESTIDIESSPHLDPAVVAAQPMSRQPRQTDPLTQPTFGRPGFGDQLSKTADSVSNDQPKPYSQAADPNIGLDFTSSSFGQSGLSQNLPGDSMFPSVGDSTPQISHTMIGQSVTENSVSQFDLPPSIPMPPTQDDSEDASQAEKKFTMNASAPVFQSMYSQSGSQGALSETGSQQGPASQDADSPTYQNNRYAGDGAQRGGRGGNGFRGNRGGSRGGSSSNGMQNGFTRGQGSRGRGAAAMRNMRGRGGGFSRPAPAPYH
ncbi:caprin-1-like isoform X2 [Gigantopelta aegis]|uniref:caprin-1-like isoform X2 n=1 Tax=Gigantopelta aegis TaxID=1735272 RepID=UPI001B88DAEA|nr:caprin-1-like isoform X2 [Gigantopelta aegis]